MGMAAFLIFVFGQPLNRLGAESAQDPREREVIPAGTTKAERSAAPIYRV